MMAPKSQLLHGNDQHGGFSIAGLRPDLVAGLTAAAVVLPKAMAYATVAGLPVSVGLYTAFVPMIVYALLGTSRVLSVSSTTTLAILTGAQLALVVPDGDPGKLITAAATLAALTGALLIAASVLRLGFVANFISSPVLTGFKAGIAFVIILDQVPKLLGVHLTKEGFFRDVFGLASHLPDTSPLTLVIARRSAGLPVCSRADLAPFAGSSRGGRRGYRSLMAGWTGGYWGSRRSGLSPSRSRRSHSPISRWSSNSCPVRSASP